MRSSSLRATLIVCLVGTSLQACGDAAGLVDDGSQTAAPLQRGAPFRTCLQDTFVAPDPTGFHNWRSRLKASGAPCHHTQDIVSLPGVNVTLGGKFAYGVFSADLEGESISVAVNACDRWASVGEFTTNDTGTGHLSLATDALGLGQFGVTQTVEGDATSVASTLLLVPPGTHFVVFDVDGTLTFAEMELLQKNPRMRADAAALTQLWAAKGYAVIYLTGRPVALHSTTLAWLRAFDFAPGTTHLSESAGQLLPTNAGVGDYKLAYLRHLMDMGFHVDFAYGNSKTDRYAYGAAGIPLDNIYYVGTAQAADGAQAIDAYRDHLQTVRTLPNATQPF